MRQLPAAVRDLLARLRLPTSDELVRLRDSILVKLIAAWNRLARLRLPPPEQVIRVRNSILVIAAPAFLGAAAGILTGQTGADSTVVAALLPPVLAGIGGALLAFKLKKDGDQWARNYVVASAAVVVFSFFLVAGMYVVFEGNESATERIREVQRQRYAEDLDFRAKSLLRCSQHEAEVNARRVAALLDPLPSEAFCDIGPVDAR